MIDAYLGLTAPLSMVLREALRRTASRRGLALSGPAVYPSIQRVPISVEVRRGGELSPRYTVSIQSSATAKTLAIFSEGLPNPQLFSRDLIYQEVVATAYEYTEPRMGSTRWPTLSETANTLLFNLTEGDGGSQVSTVPAVVDIFATVDNLSQTREAVIVERMDDGQWRIAGQGVTVPDALNTLDLKVTTSGVLYALGLDDYGTKFVPNKAVVVGERVRPSTYGGWVYEVSEPGVLPAQEPSWWAAIGDNVPRLVGTASLQARRYYQPISHGPIRVELV